MISRKNKRSKAWLIIAIAVLLLSIVIPISSCASNESNGDEMQNADITVTVAAPTGKTSDIPIDSWVYELFTKEEPVVFYDVSATKSEEAGQDLINFYKAPMIAESLAEYVKDVQVKLLRRASQVNSKTIYVHDLVGITSLACEEQLLPENGGQITWFEGYDESIFSGEEPVCIIPERKVNGYNNGKGEMDLYFATSGVTMVDGKPEIEKKETEYHCTLKIVGTYTGGDGESSYCPASIVMQVFDELGETMFLRSMSMTLADNSRLDEFREKAKLYFIEPSPEAAETPWGHTLVGDIGGVNQKKHFEFYPFALDIKKGNLPLSLENGVDGDLLTAVIIAASFIVGVLLVVTILCIRKRRIAREQMEINATNGEEGEDLQKKQKKNRIKFAYVRAVLLVLLAASAIILSALCVINKVKLHKQEEALRSVPITVTVRTLRSEYGGNYVIHPWTIDLFTGKNPVELINDLSASSEPLQVSLSEYLKDIQIKMSYRIAQLNGSPVYRQQGENYPDLIGITSIPSDERLLPENGCEITWYEGYDESILGGEDLVCLVPEGKAEAYDNGNGEAELYFYFSRGRMENGTYVEVSRTEHECTLKIVGTYTAGDEASIYCPFSIIEQVYDGLGDSLDVDSISATLADNLLLDEFREKASFFYSNLSENAEEVSDELSVLNRSYTYNFDNDGNALDISGSDQSDFFALCEESDRFNRTAIRIIAVLAFIAVLLLVIPKIHIRKRKATRVRKRRTLNPKKICAFILKGISNFVRRCLILIKHTLNRIKRSPVRAVAVLLFAAVIAMIICALQASNDEEMRHYEEAYQAVPIKFSVNKPSMADKDSSSLMHGWVLDLFTGENPVEIVDVSAAIDSQEKWAIVDNTEPTKISLQEYVKDLQVKMTYSIRTINGKKYTGAIGTTCLYGMTSIYSDKQLLPEYGCEIKWYEGYDESIFAGDEPVCLIPESKATAQHYDNGNGEAELYFFYSRRQMIDGVSVEVESGEYECKLKIVGTYTAGDELSIYCPFPIIEQVYEELEQEYRIDSLSGTIADNMRLGEFLEKADMFFMDPSQKDEEIPWGIVVFNREDEYPNEFYLYAMDINDEHLAELSAILKESIKFNRFVTVLVVILSVISGFLVGFLMIRRRKRDIILMRTVGESNFDVYFGFVLEQMICIILGIAVGGAYYMWNPIDKLAIFAIVYFVALTLALVIFMSKKLIKNIKEDE